MNFVKLIHSKLSVEEICETVSSSSCGAISIFVGTTRDNFENKKVIQLEYEAYEPMAEKAMQQVCQTIREKWNVENIGIYHRLGIVPVKEASVVIAVSSPHRAESLEAVHCAIDTLKASVPIWKKEIYDSSKAEWKANKELESEKQPELLLNDGVVPSEGNEIELKEVSSEIPFVSPELIQIKAGTKEIKRRISSFIEKKREQIDLGNVQDFCYHGNISTEKMSCARVDALLVRRKDSKSHLRVHRVLNPWGPQTRGVDPGSMSCINSQGAPIVQDNQDCREFHEGGVKQEPNGLEDVKPVINNGMFQPGIEERLKNAEIHLKMRGPVSQDVYVRLKQIEDRILYLEGLSPEYFQFWAGARNNSTTNFKPSRKRTYSASDLNNKLQELEHKLSVKEIQ